MEKNRSVALNLMHVLLLISRSSQLSVTQIFFLSQGKLRNKGFRKMGNDF